MEKEIRKFLTSISMLGLLASCTETSTLEARNDNASMAAQSIRTFVDHDELARRYENRARKLLEIAAEHEKRLQYYEDKSHPYGRHEQDLQSHATLVQKYKQAAEKATRAAFHHRMASQPAKRDYIASMALH
jgi:predicted ribosome quality control (RQC) complex YloA/Tae2 family protein